MLNPDEIGYVTYRGPEIDDLDILAILPAELQALLLVDNGFILWHGGLHVRGACSAPSWHSLRAIMCGDSALHTLYPEVTDSDVPFAQDCFGDQFLFREDEVWLLSAETCELERVAGSLPQFFEEVAADPEEFLNIDIDRHIEPGSLILAYPPFCMKAENHEYSLRPVSAAEVIAFHAHFASSIRELPDGAQIEVKITP